MAGHDSKAGPSDLDLVERFRRTRRETERLAEPLSDEDQMLQAMPDASPTKWHRAHTTWFFEQFVLGTVDERTAYLFNSYYETVGDRHPRPQRGLLSRPSCAEVRAYRARVDEQMHAALPKLNNEQRAVVELGIAHEEQHQELILTDILAAFAQQRWMPEYAPAPRAPAAHGARDDVATRITFDGGLVEIGARSSSWSFAFDIERPRHRVYLQPFALSSRLISVRDVKAFAADGGYSRPALWLSDGWRWVAENHVDAPGYARFEDGGGVAHSVLVMRTLHGERVAHDDEPASHLSFYEADAIARFLGGRLPTEAEWEHASTHAQLNRGRGQFRDDDDERALVPLASAHESMFGGVWQWTSSPFTTYPGFKPESGALGEYNAKFTCNQMVLRGGSCLTNRASTTSTTRNFWPAATRFQMTGARVAFDLDSMNAKVQ